MSLTAGPPISPDESLGAGPRRSPGRRRPRVLLAEDDSEMRDLLIWALVDSGYDVDAVADGTSLCHHLAQHLTAPGSGRIDLVLSDIRMPGVTGLEVIRGLRELDNLPPTILITAFGDAEIHRQADEIGVVLLDKPFEIEDLMARVGEILPPRGSAS